MTRREAWHWLVTAALVAAVVVLHGENQRREENTKLALRYLLLWELAAAESKEPQHLLGGSTSDGTPAEIALPAPPAKLTLEYSQGTAYVPIRPCVQQVLIDNGGGAPAWATISP